MFKLDYRRRKSVTVTASGIWLRSGDTFFGDNSESPFPPLTLHCLWPQDWDHMLVSESCINWISTKYYFLRSGYCVYLTNSTCKEPLSDCRSLHMCCSMRRPLLLDNRCPCLGSPLQPLQGSLQNIWVTLGLFLLCTCGHWIRVATAIVLTVEGAVVISRPEELSLFCVDNAKGEMMRGL